MPVNNDIPLIVVLALATILPFLIACGTCYIKFSIVFVMVRNALGLQQIPSNMTLNGVALLLAMFVMSPIIKSGYTNYQESKTDITQMSSLIDYIDNGIDPYRNYLTRYSDPDLSDFFEKIQSGREATENGEQDEPQKLSILSLLPAYALSEIKNAFKIGFYLYLPFVVIDLLISCILLALGMMMMSPVTISVPIKLVLFVVMDGWTILSKGLVLQYMDLPA
ncbi:EscR/YscR/HrcR family type III secretion system export apparatus protein [Rouxiella badensis]|jgi:type III secretion apparatus YscR/HrcR family protein|uniref:EscR/YscR/HrcR family type III secretion system export apparatus protein n=1 Tax=Rouxiella badensis TaxID=1646377 RepID=A0A1X0WGF8_9GAMM|nr:EscR/YscR/HrcR family type III secretion system export apparatus protein [Rouxiella badensis]MCC3701528.1 EscR/YscR/HrcR family type III secretion system export apparatus protein [Rouxiella badensis]MCC3747254.1 EscR/YscR/HrcR family type III secretion system export apparatus protein [Rouxiella badensis]ORJ25888.1 EscR/YscR/HrcR family type III secretion system export apparatus protein [Rouxiella badensis]QII38919.1 EscR/YscR/HrcR family type III secretion system export apparatus protein [Ro